MPGFQDAPLVGPGFELQLTLEGARLHEDVIAEALPATVVEPEAVASFSVVELGEEAEALELDLALARVGAREENLYVAGERLAARAASPATRRQYVSIHRSFGDWLRAELDRPPVTSDLTGDAIGAFGRHLEQTGGRGGGPAAPATRRVYLNMVRALARDLGLAEEAARVRVPRHRAGPPETLTDSTTPTCSASPTAAPSSAGATSRCSVCSATAACAPPNCADSWPGICGALGPTRVISGCSCTAWAPSSAR